MIKELKYNGHTASPSDYESPDGDLAVSMNLIPEDGALNPIYKAQMLFKLDDGKRVTFIHKVGVYIHYIIEDSVNKKIYWKDGVNGELKEITEYLSTVRITAVGNILVISDGGGLSYFYFDGNKYRNLGDGTPPVSILFSLKGQNRRETNTTSGLKVKRTGGDSEIIWGEETLIFRQEIKAYSYGEATYVDVNIVSGNKYRFKQPYYTPTIDYFDLYYVEEDGTETFWKKINGSDWKNLTADKTCKRLKICLFWLQNAGIDYISSTLEIYNQAFTIVTHPVTIEFDKSPDNLNAILGICNPFITKCHEENKFIYPFFLRYAFVLYDGTEAFASPPIFMAPNYNMIPFLPFTWKYTEGNEVDVHAFAVACDIRMHIASSDLSPWKDLISGINIYATAPTFTYKQAATYEEDSETLNVLKTAEINDYKLYTTASDGGEFKKKTRWIKDRFRLSYSGNLPDYYFQIPLRTDEDILQDSMSNQTYRCIKSYTIDELDLFSGDVNKQVDIILDKGTLNIINTLPLLKATTAATSDLLPSTLCAYNNRLLVSSNAALLPKGYNPFQLNPYFETYIGEELSKCIYLVKLYIQHDGIEETLKIVTRDLHPCNPLFWFYYPSPSAKKVEIFRVSYSLTEDCYYAGAARKLNLKQHDFLPGVYAFYFVGLNFIPIQPQKIDWAEWNDTRPQKETSGKIYVSDVSNPFVFDPANVIAFAAGNIISMAIATKALSQGQFGEHPLYVFSTEGVWALEVSSDGTFSAKQPITRDVCSGPGSITQIDSAVLFSTDRGIMLLSGSTSTCISESINTSTPFLFTALPKAKNILKLSSFTEDHLAFIPFGNFLKKCGMLYDYTHQRIIVYNPGCPYAYVFSLKSKGWGMMESNIISGVNSYPEALAMDKEGNLVNFSTATSETHKALLVSRPLKLDMPDLLKTVDTVIQRGNFKKGHIQSLLYGSRNLSDWHLVWSSKDHFLRGFSGTPYKYFRIVCIVCFEEGESLFGASIQFKPRQNNQLR